MQPGRRLELPSISFRSALPVSCSRSPLPALVVRFFSCSRLSTLDPRLSRCRALWWATGRKDPGRRNDWPGGSARRVHRHRPPDDRRNRRRSTPAPTSASAKVTASSAVSNGPSPQSCRFGLFNSPGTPQFPATEEPAATSFPPTRNRRVGYGVWASRRVPVLCAGIDFSWYTGQNSGG